MKEHTTNIFRILVLLALAIILFNAYFYDTQKEDYYLDEKYSFFAANANLFSLKDIHRELKDSGYNLNQVIEIEKSKIVSEKGVRYSLDDVNSMLDAQKGDKYTIINTLLLDIFDSHPPLYYLLFNFVDSSISGITLKSAGFLINIVALLVTCFLIYKIASLLVGQSCAFFAMIFYGLGFDYINNVTYCRMYALLSMWFALLVYLYLKWYQHDYSFEDNGLLRWICVVEFLAMLTQYFALLFVLPLFVITIVIFRKRGKPVKRYLVHQIRTAVIFFLIWPVSIFQLIFDPRSADIRSASFFTGLPIRINYYLRLLKNSVFAGNKYFYALAIVAVIAFIAVNVISIHKSGELQTFVHSDKFVYCIYIWGPAAFYYMFSVGFTPYIDPRYMMPVIPYIALVVVISFWELLKMGTHRNWICVAVMVCLIIFEYTMVRGLYPYYLYKTTSEKRDFLERYEGM